jgi:hypothetical protein
LNSSPASVGLMPRVVRLRSRMPSSTSSRAILLLTIDFEMPRLGGAVESAAFHDFDEAYQIVQVYHVGVPPWATRWC